MEHKVLVKTFYPTRRAENQAGQKYTEANREKLRKTREAWAQNWGQPSKSSQQLFKLRWLPTRTWCGWLETWRRCVARNPGASAIYRKNQERQTRASKLDPHSICYHQKALRCSTESLRKSCTFHWDFRSKWNCLQHVTKKRNVLKKCRFVSQLWLFIWNIGFEWFGSVKLCKWSKAAALLSHLALQHWFNTLI